MVVNGILVRKDWYVEFVVVMVLDVLEFVKEFKDFMFGILLIVIIGKWVVI